MQTEKYSTLSAPQLWNSLPGTGEKREAPCRARRKCAASTAIRDLRRDVFVSDLRRNREADSRREERISRLAQAPKHFVLRRK
jgi:hypothetical protein